MALAITHLACTAIILELMYRALVRPCDGA